MIIILKKSVLPVCEDLDLYNYNIIFFLIIPSMDFLFSN